VYAASSMGERRWRCVCLTVVLISGLLIASQAQAQVRVQRGAPQARKWAETLEFAIVGGYALLDATGANDDVDHDGGWSLGFLLGYNFNDWLAVHFEYRTVNSQAISDRPGLPSGECVTSRCDVSTHAFGLSGLYNIQGGRYFVHFAKISAGGFTSVAGNFTGSGGYVGMGLGTRFFPLARSPIHLRLEAEFNGQFPGTAAVQGQDISTHSTANLRLSAGIGYLFD
jgi:hypothetical protein